VFKNKHPHTIMVFANIYSNKNLAYCFELVVFVSLITWEWNSCFILFSLPQTGEPIHA